MRQIIFTFLVCGSLVFSAESFAAKRIVSIGGTITEIIYALGHGDKIVGVDVTSIYPEEVKNKKKQLGHQSKISAEGVLSLKPDLVIVGSSASRLPLIEQLRGTSINVQVIQEEDNFQSIFSKVDQVSSLLAEKKEGERLKAKIKSDIEQARSMKKMYKNTLAMFVYARGPGQVFVAGKDTSADYMLRQMGLKNAFSKVSGFKPIASESLVSANPDLVLMQEAGAKGLANSVWEIPGMDLTKAGSQKKLISVSTLPFLGFGPRTGEELIRLVQEVNVAKSHVQN